MVMLIMFVGVVLVVVLMVVLVGVMGDLFNVMIDVVRNDMLLILVLKVLVVDWLLVGKRVYEIWVKVYEDLLGFI